MQKKPIKKSIKKTIKNIYSFILVTLLGGSIFIYAITAGKNTSDNATIQTDGLQKITSNREVVYPKQYSDINITENAKITDSKYKNISLVEKDSLLSNVISSVVKSGPIDERVERGTWLWTPIKYITPEYSQQIISGAKKNGVNTIYLSIDSYLDIFVMQNGEEKEKAKKDFENTLVAFLTLAHKNGIEVDAEAGWQNWAQDGNSYKPEVILDYVINFNKKNKQKFRGFQYDVEVYLLPEYKKDKRVTLYSFVSLVDQTVVKLNNTDLLFSVVIPEFYDGSTEETPIYSYRGKKAYTLEHLLSVLERRKGSKLILMSYRNYSTGDNGTIDVSRHEVSLANKYNTKIIVAQETGNVPPPYITFYKTSKKYYNRQLALVYKAFETDKSFGGTATHYINSFLELK